MFPDFEILAKALVGRNPHVIGFVADGNIVRVRMHVPGGIAELEVGVIADTSPVPTDELAAVAAAALNFFFASDAEVVEAGTLEDEAEALCVSMKQLRELEELLEKPPPVTAAGSRLAGRLRTVIAAAVLHDRLHQVLAALLQVRKPAQ